MFGRSCLANASVARATRHVGELVRAVSAIVAGQPDGRFVRHSHWHNLSGDRYADGSFRIRRLRRTSACRRQTQADALLSLQPLLRATHGTCMITMILLGA